MALTFWSKLWFTMVFDLLVQAVGFTMVFDLLVKAAERNGCDLLVKAVVYIGV